MKRIALAQLAAANNEAEAAIANRIVGIKLARDVGCSWQEIGDVLHVSRQTAHKRYGRAVGEPDEVTMKAAQRIERIADGEGVPAVWS